MNMEDRLRAHYAERTEREPLPGPDTEQSLDRLLSGEILTPKPTDHNSSNVRRFPFRPLALAAAVLAVCAIAGVLVIQSEDDNSVSNFPDDDHDEEQRPDPTTSSTTQPPTPSSSVPSPPPETPAAPTASSLSVVVARWGVVGWWDGTTWVSRPDDSVLPVVGGEEYQIVRLDDSITTSVGGWGDGCIASGDERGDVDAGIPLDYDEWTTSPIAVTGVPTPRPRPVQVVEASSADRTAAVGVLAGLGIDDPNPNIRRVVESDMDGDGTEEVVVVADRLRPETPYLADPGDYSVVFVRQLVGGVQRTVVIANNKPSIEAWDGLYYLEYSQIAAVVDLNGDGRMELVVESGYYEGSGVDVYEIQPDGSFHAALEGGCGS